MRTAAGKRLTTPALMLTGPRSLGAGYHSFHICRNLRLSAD
jgi:hypothetical protein